MSVVDFIILHYSLIFESNSFKRCSSSYAKFSRMTLYQIVKTYSAIFSIFIYHFCTSQFIQSPLNQSISGRTAMEKEKEAEKPRIKQEEEQLIKPFVLKNDRGRKSFATWGDLMLKENVEAGIKQCGFHFPSEVQYMVIPEITNSARRDVLCQAKSGMGKTNVYLISILELLKRQKEGDYKLHQCIIIASTRQLAHQIYLAMLRLSKDFTYPPLHVCAFFGGISVWDNKFQLRYKNTKPHVLIGTLGRLRHLIKDDKIITNNVQILVVDECDLIIEDREFLEDLKSIMRRLPSSVQLLMFTATLPELSKQHCMALMKPDHKVIQLSTIREIKTQNLQHYFIEVPEEKKGERLIFLLDNLPFSQAIIFVNTIERAKTLVTTLKTEMFNPLCIHSDLSQEERLHIYDQLKHNLSRFLITTDVFGRGIDIEHLNMVFNYDFPTNEETYMHRAGRAGRFGRKGKCLSFLPPKGNNKDKDWVRLDRVVKKYNLKIYELPKTVSAFTF